MLRPFRLDEAGQLSHLAGVAEIAKQTLNIPYPFPPGRAEKWIKSTHEDMAADLGLSLALTRRGEDSLVGAAGVTRDQGNAQSAELGYWVARTFWGEGYATEAVTRLLDHGKDALGLTRIWACAFAENGASLRVLEKLGMTATGTRAENCPQRGGMCDIAYYEMGLD